MCDELHAGRLHRGDLVVEGARGGGVGVARDVDPAGALRGVLDRARVVRRGRYVREDRADLLRLVRVLLRVVGEHAVGVAGRCRCGGERARLAVLLAQCQRVGDVGQVLVGLEHVVAAVVVERERADEGEHLVLQVRVGVLVGSAVGLPVRGDQFELPPVHAADAVDVVDVGPHAVRRGLEETRHRAGEVGDVADRDGGRRHTHVGRSAVVDRTGRRLAAGPAGRAWQRRGRRGSGRAGDRHAAGGRGAGDRGLAGLGWTGVPSLLITGAGSGARAGLAERRRGRLLAHLVVHAGAAAGREHAERQGMSPPSRGAAQTRGPP